MMTARSNATLISGRQPSHSKGFGLGEAASAGLLAAVVAFLMVLAFSPERHSRKRRDGENPSPEQREPAAARSDAPQTSPACAYPLPSLEGCPPTNHRKIRQLNADIDGVVEEFCLTHNPQGDGPVCPICLHGIEFCNGIYCDVEFRQTDRNGITKTVQCFCKMRRRDIIANWERLITIDEPAFNVLDLRTYEERRRQRSS